ncbi:tripartite tricarboxylate transporter substrate binding protein [Roseomonas sp. NAR14]|uniref:Tripartite tricarboxylate transporter substrate binding protein n=1 Tax=Roseomonas acroporae TaxID=2937791 RepID=A0A9X2BYN0_9PROT|nr:tripartite tricarboxylate transporter substrate binding protein [Roseomonas acroporae]MCK8786210.1 tripartite tricarboxylate transporter substrate binding protein [Roseomonas acroporae]
MHRRRLLALLPAAALAARAMPASARPAFAATGAAPEAWPDRSVRLIVPVAAGGSQDIVARLLARALSEPLGQSVLVDNHPGAGSNLGYELAARSRPDGYTLLAGSDSLSINRALFPRLSFDPLRDFAPVLRAVKVPQILVVKADSPARSLEDLVELGRRAPLAIGTPGNGSLAHLTGALVQEATDLRWTHVPYRGGALAINDLMSGALQGVLINIGAVTDHVRAGRLRGLFVTSGARSVALPDVPTLAEAGLPGIEAVGWHGLVAPAGTDPAIVERVNREARAAMAKPELRERLLALGVEPQDEGPEALAEVLRADAERWGAVIRRIGARPD